MQKQSRARYWTWPYFRMSRAQRPANQSASTSEDDPSSTWAWTSSLVLCQIHTYLASLHFLLIEPSKDDNIRDLWALLAWKRRCRTTWCQVAGAVTSASRGASFLDRR